MITLICPNHQISLTTLNAGVSYNCSLGCHFSVIRNIPRFVPQENYASGFGLQWNIFRATQLDSYTGLSISKDRLVRMAGGSLAIFNEKTVLEAGCGAGRFTEILLQAGASVFAVDLSTAVEANYQNCHQYPNYFVCQADILKLPIPPEQVDIVVCIGVVQHTPNPEAAMTALCSYLKPGGLLIMDHYTAGYPTTPSRRMLREFLLKRSPRFAMIFCKIMTVMLWPIHCMLWRWKQLTGFAWFRQKFLVCSPIVDYHDAYPQLGAKLLYEWAILDTHDTLTDRYKYLRSAEELQQHLTQCGMVDVETVYAGNGVEVRAKKPVRAVR